MTASATVKQADLKRIAKAAKAEGVTFWIQLADGRRIGCSPIAGASTLDESPETDLDRDLAEFDTKHGYS